jgi:ABC-type molybdate transport system ATPase subunit
MNTLCRNEKNTRVKLEIDLHHSNFELVVIDSEETQYISISENRCQEEQAVILEIGDSENHVYFTLNEQQLRTLTNILKSYL